MKGHGRTTVAAIFVFRYHWQPWGVIGVFEHHQAAIRAATKELSAWDEVLGVIIYGSVAHGFALENSDVDIKIVCTEAFFSAKERAGNIGYFDRGATHYEGGYVDGEFTTLARIERVAADGTEPARYDFQDAIVTFDRSGGLEKLARQAARYPVEQKHSKLLRFYAQFSAWKLHYYEALRRDNRYLAHLSALQFALYAGRLFLAHNETLFPWHKWFLQVLSSVPQKPAGLMRCMNTLIDQKRAEDIERLYNMVSDFTDWPRDLDQNQQLLRDIHTGRMEDFPFASD
ncbi:MAG: nucleotidyltransferase domain-containing protein [Ethanoligenens sp.]